MKEDSAYPEPRPGAFEVLEAKDTGKGTPLTSRQFCLRPEFVTLGVRLPVLVPKVNGSFVLRCMAPDV